MVAGDLRIEGAEETIVGLPHALAVDLDVRSSSAAAHAVAAAEEMFGGLDALAHVAGVEVDRPVDLLLESQGDCLPALRRCELRYRNLPGCRWRVSRQGSNHSLADVTMHGCH